MDVRPEHLQRFVNLVNAAERANGFVQHIDAGLDLNDLPDEQAEALEAVAYEYREAFAAARDIPVDEPEGLADFLEQAWRHSPDDAFRRAVASVMHAHVEQLKGQVDDGRYGLLDPDHLQTLERLVAASRPYGGDAEVHADALDAILTHATRGTARAFLLAVRAGVFDAPGPDAHLSTEHRAVMLPEDERRWHYVPAALDACPRTALADEFHDIILTHATAHLAWARADLMEIRARQPHVFASDPDQANWWATIYANFTIQLARATRFPNLELLGDDVLSLS